MPGDYSEELEDLIAPHLEYGAKAVLGALAAAGRLVPEGSRVEWRCAALGGSGRRDHAAEAQTRQHAAQTGHPIEYRITTPWTPAEPAQEER